MTPRPSINLTRRERKCPAPSDMETEDLKAYCATHGNKIFDDFDAFKPYLLDLRGRLTQVQWNTYCHENFGRGRRTIDYRLVGGNKNRAPKVGKHVSQIPAAPTNTPVLPPTDVKDDPMAKRTQGTPTDPDPDYIWPPDPDYLWPQSNWHETKWYELRNGWDGFVRLQGGGLNSKDRFILARGRLRNPNYAPHRFMSSCVLIEVEGVTAKDHLEWVEVKEFRRTSAPWTAPDPKPPKSPKKKRDSKKVLKSKKISDPIPCNYADDIVVGHDKDGDIFERGPCPKPASFISLKTQDGEEYKEYVCADHLDCATDDVDNFDTSVVTDLEGNICK